MPKYLYTAKSYSGEMKGGEIISKDEKTLAQQLRSEGFLVTSIKLVAEKQEGINIKILDRFKNVPLKDKMIFARNLSVMISSGLPVSRAVNNLATQARNKQFKKILSDVHDEMQAGKTLSEGLGKYPLVFSELFVNMVRVGEAGGNLDEVLKIVATQLEKEHELISKVKGAMTYPAVILVVMVLIGIAMLTFVLPKLTGVFTEMNVQLPLMTRIVVGMSDVLRKNSLSVIVTFVVVVVALKLFLQQEIGKRALSYVTAYAPIISNIVIKVNCARFSRIYSSLLRSGISVVDALNIIARTLTNRLYRDALYEAIEDVQKGVTLSSVLLKHDRLFPIMVVQILEVGEETGKTETVLLQIAEFYEEEVNQITKNMSSIIEPVLMVVIGGSVGFFAVAMMQPMYSIMENIK